MEKLFDEPIIGIPMFEPISPIKPGDVLLGYRVIEKKPGVFRNPSPADMTVGGWLSVGILAILCWPLSCLPCCMTCSYPDTYQVPVYG